MPALVAGIHVLFCSKIKELMAGTSPAMTLCASIRIEAGLARSEQPKAGRLLDPTLDRRSSSGRRLAETPRQQSPEPVAERARIRRPVAVEHARFVE
jgi:hypothetical protein